MLQANKLPAPKTKSLILTFIFSEMRAPVRLSIGQPDNFLNTGVVVQHRMRFAVRNLFSMSFQLHNCGWLEFRCYVADGTLTLFIQPSIGQIGSAAHAWIVGASEEKDLLGRLATDTADWQLLGLHSCYDSDYYNYN